jgi:hypothetical protein
MNAIVNVVLAVGAGLCLVLYLMRRKSRLKAED